MTSLMEEIDLFLTLDDSMPPDIENDDYESKGDIIFLEELLSNDSPPENESFHFDVSNIPRLPIVKPPDDDEIEPDTGVLQKWISPDYEASRARGFALRSLELQSLA
ncbi:hypothetical protein Tco_1083026 [Tanacetum coccineum]|uniref:Uncharacterized protein n=1 Tax=Tanacetum coccineum TaxID=301880 RepID=A0ABQ5I394_9ASTR